MNDDDEVTLICWPVAMSTLVTPGSVERNCWLCDQAVWVAPSGQDLLREHEDARIVCAQCFRPPTDGSKPEPITQRQLEEFKTAIRVRDRRGRRR